LVGWVYRHFEHENSGYAYLFFIYKLRTQCHTITAETVQNSNRHWRRPTQVLKHLRVALKHKHKNHKLLNGKNFNDKYNSCRILKYFRYAERRTDRWTDSQDQYGTLHSCALGGAIITGV